MVPTDPATAPSGLRTPLTVVIPRIVLEKCEHPLFPTGRYLHNCLSSPLGETWVNHYCLQLFRCSMSLYLDTGPLSP